VSYLFLALSSFATLQLATQFIQRDCCSIDGRTAATKKRRKKERSDNAARAKMEYSLSLNDRCINLKIFGVCSNVEAGVPMVFSVFLLCERRTR